MGRGSNSQAVGAQGLLYGRKRRGSGPSPVANLTIDQLSWHQFMQRTINLCHDNQLLPAPITLERKDRRSNSSVNLNDANNLGRELFLIAWDDLHLRLIVAQEDGRRGLGLAVTGMKLTRIDENDLLYRNSGPAPFADGRQAEDLFRPALIGEGFQFIDRIVDGDELVARESEVMDFFPLMWAQPADSSNRRTVAHQIINQAWSKDILNDQQEALLHMRVDEAPEETNYCRLLFDDELGREALAAAPEAPIRLAL